MAVNMDGEERIAAPLAKVWEMLNDPEILKACIPGCSALEMSSPNELAATVVLRIGPIKATFNGVVTLENLDPPNAYTIVGEGKGGVAGFAKGGADVTLHAEGESITILRYKARADVGGKIAQLGSRLIQSTSKKLAGEFFSDFNSRASAALATQGAGAHALLDADPAEAPDSPTDPTVPSV